MSVQALLLLSRQLHEVNSLADVMDHVVDSITRHTRYRRAWLLLPLPVKGLEVIGYALDDRVRVENRMAELDLSADPWIAHHLTATEPFVVDDLREEPRADQKQVAYFGNRTVISVPMLHLAERIGALCVGTFASEGVIPPTKEELDFVVQIGALISVVASRLLAEADRRALEEELGRAQRMELLGRLAGEVAHDFNNLLVVISGNAQLAKHLLAEHEAVPLITEVEDAARRAAGLTRQLLAFSRGQPLERRQVDVATIVLGMAGMLRSLLPANVTLDVSHGEGPMPVQGDSGQLEQILMNLVVNARDALPKGGTITVEVAAATLDAAAIPVVRAAGAPGDFITLTVRDDGPGMAAAISARVFEPFFTTKRAGAGTGLGLAVVDSVVRRHGGFIEVSSEEGHGTTFRAYLPRSATKPEQAPDASREPDAAPRGSEHVLVVEDEPQVRALIERLLTEAGYRVSVAPDGRAALDALDKLASVALIVTDLVMPELGGAELVAQLRTRHQAPEILIVTGYAPGEGAEQTYPHLLLKPFAPDTLLRKVREVLDHRVRATG